MGASVNMETKCYILVGCKHKDNPLEIADQIMFTQACGSVTEACKYLKKMYSFPEKESRQLIYKAFVRDTTLWIQIDRDTCVRISQHKMESEVRLHGCW